MTHLLSLIIFVLFPFVGARRSFRIDDTRHSAQQQNSTIADGLEASVEMREAFNPRPSGMAVLRRAGPHAVAWREGSKQIFQHTGRLEMRQVAPWFRFGPRRANVALQAVGGPGADRTAALGVSPATSDPGPRPRLSAVLFDIDGTLFDSDALHLRAFQDLLEKEGFNGGRRISESFHRERISGRQNVQIVRDLLPEKNDAEGALFSAQKEARFRELAATELPALVTPGLEELLSWLVERGVLCAAVTNAPRENAELMLGAIGRSDWFKPLIIGDECSAGKPCPEPYLRAMRELGVTPDECIAFEDSPSGARAAVAAGVRTIGITSTQTAEALEQAGCVRTIDDFTDVDLWEELEHRCSTGAR